MRIPALLAAAALVTSLAACGGSAGDDGAKKGTLNLGFVYATTSQNPFQEMALGAKAAAEDAGDVDLDLQAPSSLDGPKQVSLMRSSMRKATDGIAMQTLTPDLFVRPLNQASDLDIPLVTVDTKPPEGTDVGLFVGNSNTALGRTLGEAIVQHIPEDKEGEVVLGNDIPGLTLLEQRLDGVQQVLQEKRPRLKILGPFDAGSEPNVNLTKWKGIVKAHPDAVAYIGAGASDAVSLSLIQKNSGRRFLVGSCDPDPQALKGLQDGYVTALASPEHWMKGYVAVRLLAEHARTGKPLPEGWWDSGSLLIDAKNIDEIVERQENAKTRKTWFESEAKKQVADPKRYLKPMSEAD